MRLDKGLYGLRRSVRRWYMKFSRHLGEWGFVASTADPCLFIKRSEDGLSEIRVLLFVDDLAMFNDADDAGRELKADLNQGAVLGVLRWRRRVDPPAGVAEMWVPLVAVRVDAVDLWP